MPMVCEKTGDISHTEHVKWTVRDKDKTRRRGGVEVTIINVTTWSMSTNHFHLQDIQTQFQVHSNTSCICIR